MFGDIFLAYECIIREKKEFSSYSECLLKNNISHIFSEMPRVLKPLIPVTEPDHFFWWIKCIIVPLGNPFVFDNRTNSYWQRGYENTKSRHADIWRETKLSVSR